MINNLKNLAKNPLRRKALLIAEAGYQAIEIEKVVRQKIKIRQNMLSFFLTTTSGSKIAAANKKTDVLKIDLNKYKRIFLIGVGKGSARASATLAKILGKKLTAGIALDVQYQEVQPPKINCVGRLNLSKLKFLVGTHPLPSKQNIKATQKIIKLLKNLKKDDLLIAFICGGGSVLLCASEKERKNSILTTKLLTQAGANILELNTVRKHLSLVKAGGLAKLAYPATVISLIVSDVLGNDLSIVASGPTVFNKTTKKDAEKIWKKYQYREVRPPQINGNIRRSNLQKLKFQETPKEKKYFKKVKNILFLSNREPILAMAEKAKELGFEPKIYSYSLRGEAKNALLSLFKTLPYREAKFKGEVILAGGETTVTLKNLKLKSQKLGKGGRNQEAVLGAIAQHPELLSHKIAIISLASDGRDNTEAAGAIGDILTIKKAQKLKLNPQKYLNNHNSFNFFKKTGDLIFAKQKTFNVSDLMIVLKL